MEEKKKIKSSHKRLYIILGIIAALLLIYFIGGFDNTIKDYSDMKTLFQSQPDMIVPICISFIIFIFTIVSMTFLAIKKKHMFIKILKSLKIMWLELSMPFTVLIIMFLGWLHANYPYESYFSENVTASFSILTNATMSIYNYGVKFPGWGWILIWGGLFGFGIWNIIDVWREPKSSNDLDKPKGLNTTKSLGEQHEEKE